MKSLKVNNEVPKYIMGFDDINVVRLVIQNLLGNAVKFSYPNGEITIKANHDIDIAWISVADNGMGISEAKLEKIFNYMTSSDKGTGGETGTGIGLFVSKQFTTLPSWAHNRTSNAARRPACCLGCSVRASTSSAPSLLKEDSCTDGRDSASAARSGKPTGTNTTSSGNKKKQA